MKLSDEIQLAIINGATLMFLIGVVTLAASGEQSRNDVIRAIMDAEASLTGGDQNEIE